MLPSTDTLNGLSVGVAMFFNWLGMGDNPTKFELRALISASPNFVGVMIVRLPPLSVVMIASIVGETRKRIDFTDLERQLKL